MSNPRTIVCPAANRWRAYALGELPDAEIDLLSEHLTKCSACEMALSRIEQECDGELSTIREASRGIELVATDTSSVAALVAKVLARDPFDDTDATADANTPSTIRPAIAATGDRVGPYTLLERLGEGGMGAVFKARHEHTGREVALKLLRQERTPDANALARFRREMLATGKLEHRQVVQALDAGEAAGRHYLAMEFIRGQTFAELIAQQGRVPVSTACRLIADVANVLSELHERGIVHRDLKPSNLMVIGDDPAGEEVEVKILDLGLIRLLDNAESDESSSGMVVGTADYIAPEQSLDSREADARSDIYSLGCTLYAMLHGRPPFDDPRYVTFTQKAMAHVHVIPDSLAALHAELPKELAAIISKMLAKQPADRFQSAGDVAMALAPFASAGEEVDAVPVAKSASRNQVVRWWGVAVVLVAVAAGALAISQVASLFPSFGFHSHQRVSEANPENVGGTTVDNRDDQPAEDDASAEDDENPFKLVLENPFKPVPNVDDANLPIPPQLADLGKRVIYWPNAKGGNGHYYVLSENEALWTDAKTLAAKLAPKGYRSYLASITTPEENVLIANRVLGFSPAWIGMTDSEQHGGSQSEKTDDPTRKGWHWLSGEKVDYVSWGPGRPQHFNQSDFVFMYSGGAWDDGNNFALPYIVEIEPKLD